MGASAGDKGLDGLAVAIITTPSAKSAEMLAGGLLERKLAACVNIVPGVRSLFWWKNKIDEAEECLMICKTKLGLSDSLINYVCENHEYDVPEVVFIKIAGGNNDYLKWISESIVE